MPSRYLSGRFQLTFVGARISTRAAREKGSDQRCIPQPLTLTRRDVSPTLKKHRNLDTLSTDG